jgi:N-acetyl-gamma-glutamyl-phosphate reductase
MISAGVFGASGYAGLELLSLLQRHPSASLTFAASDRFAEQPCADLHAGLRGDLRFCSVADGERLAASCDVVFLATPAEVSLALAPRLLPHTKVIDLSGAFRLRDTQAFASAYGMAHTAPAPNESAHYGLVPCFGDANARLVANPGCYATAAALALAPLVAARLIAPEVIVDAISGTTGAGRRASEDFSFSELANNAFAYKVLRHQHTPEIAQTLAQLGGGGPVDVTFTAKLGPFARGILATAYARLRPSVTTEQAHTAFAQYYARYPSARLAARAENVSLRQVVGTNDVRLHLAIDERNGRVVVAAALDNLLKGAAGQAIENLNHIFDFAAGAGLDALKGHFP